MSALNAMNARVVDTATLLALRAPGRRLRPCLRCHQPFTSAGAHNRVCGKCKHLRDPGRLKGLAECPCHV